ncbi:unnamed protein product, partial [Urochloa humidicola]
YGGNSLRSTTAVSIENSLRSTTAVGNEKKRQRVYNTMFHIPWKCEQEDVGIGMEDSSTDGDEEKIKISEWFGGKVSYFLRLPMHCLILISMLKLMMTFTCHQIHFPCF